MAAMPVLNRMLLVSSVTCTTKPLVVVCCHTTGLQTPTETHKSDAPTWGRALVSAGFVSLCWQPSGCALYNRPIMTTLNVNKRRLLRFTSVQHALLYGTSVAYNLTFWEERPHAVVASLVAKAACSRCMCVTSTFLIVACKRRSCG